MNPHIACREARNTSHVVSDWMDPVVMMAQAISRQMQDANLIVTSYSVLLGSGRPSHLHNSLHDAHAKDHAPTVLVGFPQWMRVVLCKRIFRVMKTRMDQVHIMKRALIEVLRQHHSHQKVTCTRAYPFRQEQPQEGVPDPAHGVVTSPTNLSQSCIS